MNRHGSRGLSRSRSVDYSRDIYRARVDFRNLLDIKVYIAEQRREYGGALGRSLSQLSSLLHNVQHPYYPDEKDVQRLEDAVDLAYEIADIYGRDSLDIASYRVWEGLIHTLKVFLKEAKSARR